jgi:ferredoxin
MRQSVSAFSTAVPTSSAGVLSETMFGAAKVDMNKYNLKSFDEMVQEWTAEVQGASVMAEAGIYLGAKNGKEVMVDTVKVQIPRRPDQGLGAELLELAGGREDGVGITLISGLVPGGAAEHSGILPGDSLSKIALVRGDEEIVAIDTECFDYDKTVAAILSLPQVSSDDERLIISVKRLRRKPKVTLKLEYPDGEEPVTLELFAGENLRRAMLVRGVKLNDPLAQRFDSGGTGDCGAEGTCATCAVHVTQGRELLSAPSIQEAQIFKARPQWRMTCKAIVGEGLQEGEMTVRVNPRQWNYE